MSRTENATRNMFWGILYKVEGTIVPFLKRTLVIYTLGSLYLGLNGLFSSILSVLSLSELGLSSAIVYHMYKPLSENDTEKVSALLNFYRKSYQIIGIIVGLLGLCVLPFLRNLIKGEIPYDVNIYTLYIIQLLGTVVSYELFANKISLLNALQRNDIISKINGVVLLLQFVLQAVVLIAWHNYYLFLITDIFAIIVNNIFAAYISWKNYPQYRCQGKLDSDTAKDVIVKVKGMFLQKIGNIVLFSADSIVISAFLGLETLAIYQNYYLVFTAVGGFLGIIQTSLIPIVGNSIATESTKKNYDDFKKFNFLYVWITAWCAICMLCLYQPFMKLWAGESMMLSNKMMLLFTIYFFVFMWENMNYIYEEACGLFYETRWIPLSAAITNLCLNVFLVRYIGLAGVLLSTIIVAVFIYHIGFISMLFRYYFKSVDRVYNYFIRQWSYLIAICFSAFLSVLLCRMTSAEGLLLLLERFCICIIVPNLLFFLFWSHRPEYKSGLSWVREYVRLKKRK